MSNWALAGGLGKMAAGLAWQTRVGKGAIGGAGLGAVYGMFAGDSSFLGGALRGAGTGALLGGAKGWGLAAGIGGAALNTVMGGSPFWGALAGRGMYGAGRRYAMPGLRNFRGLRAAGVGLGASMGSGGRVAFHMAMNDAKRAGRFIGRTARKAVNPIKSAMKTGGA